MADEICSYEACDELATAECCPGFEKLLFCKVHLLNHIFESEDITHKTRSLYYELKKETTDSILSVLNERKSSLQETRSNFSSALDSFKSYIEKLASEWNSKIDEHISELDEIIEQVSKNSIRKKGFKIPENIFSGCVAQRQEALDKLRLEPKKYCFVNLNNYISSAMKVENELGITSLSVSPLCLESPLNPFLETKRKNPSAFCFPLNPFLETEWKNPFEVSQKINCTAKSKGTNDVSFVAPQEREGAYSTNINNIVAMQQFQAKSIEELRYEDYKFNKETPQHLKKDNVFQTD